jgi:CheY-like chemotaxis protein/HEAT repeat protein
MDLFKGFNTKDMIEQIMILTEVNDNKMTEAIPYLMDLYVTPVADNVVDEMIYHTLFDILPGQTEMIISGIKHNSERVCSLAVRRAGESVDEAALPSLIDLLNQNPSAEICSQILCALDNFDNPQIGTYLLPLFHDSDYSVVAWAMRITMKYKNEKTQDTLEKMIITGSEKSVETGDCELPTLMAINHIASFADNRTSDLLISYIHHPIPMLRRTIISSLVSMGPQTLPALENCLSKGNKDERIMAANIIGLMGNRKGSDTLVAELEKGDKLSENLRFAIYESLGMIKSIRSVTALNDGLQEENELVLMAVITGLENLCNPGVINIITEIINKQDFQSNNILKAISSARAELLFSEIYKNEAAGEILINHLAAGKDKDTSDFFKNILEKIDNPKTENHISLLTKEEKTAASLRIIAADDSKAMLYFYKGVAAEMGIDLTCAKDGKEALNFLKIDTDFHMMITDLNMPNMDGVELTKEVRKFLPAIKLPILMATTETEKSQSGLAVLAGVNDFISKPFTREVLEAKIKEILKL